MFLAIIVRFLKHERKMISLISSIEPMSHVDITSSVASQALFDTKSSIIFIYIISMLFLNALVTLFGWYCNFISGGTLSIGWIMRTFLCSVRLQCHKATPVCSCSCRRAANRPRHAANAWAVSREPYNHTHCLRSNWAKGMKIYSYVYIII